MGPSGLKTNTWPLERVWRWPYLILATQLATGVGKTGQREGKKWHDQLRRSHWTCKSARVEGAGGPGGLCEASWFVSDGLGIPRWLSSLLSLGASSCDFGRGELCLEQLPMLVFHLWTKSRLTQLRMSPSHEDLGCEWVPVPDAEESLRPHADNSWENFGNKLKREWSGMVLWMKMALIYS